MVAQCLQGVCLQSVLKSHFLYLFCLFLRRVVVLRIFLCSSYVLFLFFVPRWYVLGKTGGQGLLSGRIHVRISLDGGYHVMDESPNYTSSNRPTAKQLWRPALGIVELGILGANSLLPMKSTKDKWGSTDAYCVAKYGPKWVRTRTIFESFSPRWNEQYTWEVYDPCTVLTVGVFDNR